MNSFTTDRLMLRRWRDTDSSDLYEYASSDLVGPSAGWLPHKSEQESKEIINLFLNNNETFAIELKSEEKVVGSIGIHKRKLDKSEISSKEREVGYVLNPNYWGQGIIPEAVNCLIDYGFTKLNLDTIWCSHFDFNVNSKRVCEKCGFTYRFNRSQKLSFIKNKEITTLHYSIVNTK